MRPEPTVDALDPADELWRRRGLVRRPRAIVCPPASAAEAEAVAHAFALADASADTDVVLVSDETGLAGLRALRSAGEAGLLPAFDLTGRLGTACDGVFQVGDPDSWTALARTSLSFGKRRAALPPWTRTSTDAGQRLAALMFVADRDLRLAARDDAPGAVYETGCSKTALMAAVLQLIDAGTVTCRPCDDGVVAVLTQTGREALTHGREAEAARDRPVAEACEAVAVSHAVVPSVRGRPVAPNSDAAVAASLNRDRLRELKALVGPQRIATLLARLSETLDTAFAPGSDPETVAREAHILISTAGSLGFERLSQICRDFQDAVTAGVDDTRLLHDARLAAAEAKTLCDRGSTLLSDSRSDGAD